MEETRYNKNGKEKNKIGRAAFIESGPKNLSRGEPSSESISLLFLATGIAPAAANKSRKLPDSARATSPPAPD